MTEVTVALKLQMSAVPVSLFPPTAPETTTKTEDGQRQQEKLVESLNGSPANSSVNATHNSSQRESQALATDPWRHPSLLNGGPKIRAQSRWVVALVCVHPKRRWYGMGG